MDPTRIHSNRRNGTREEEDRMTFQSLDSTLNDLAKGQKEVLHAINRLILNPEQGQNSLPISTGDRGSANTSRKHVYTHIKNTPNIYTKPSIPTMPHFLENAIVGPIMPIEPSEPFGACCRLTHTWVTW